MSENDQPSPVAPDGWHTVTPRIVVVGAGDLVAFLCDVFGAAGSYQAQAPTVVRIGDSRIMISEAGERGESPAFLYVYVPDADSMYERAMQSGAHTVEAPFDTPYGDRRCMVRDPWGNTWQIATPLRS